MEQKGLAACRMEQTAPPGVEWGVPDLSQDYLAGAASALPFFADGGFGPEALVRAAERALAVPRDQAAVAEALVRQQLSRDAPQAAARAEELRRAGATAVVTGQQPGLFGGPLLVLYKALTARGLARDLEARLGRPVVPVFWVASDDHDFEEIRSTTLLDAAGNLRSLRYTPRREPLGLPASHVGLDETIVGLLDELEGALPAGPNRDALLGLLRRCYRPTTTLAAAFARLLSGLLPDLVVLDPADPALKALMLPVLSRELSEASPTSRAAAALAPKLAAAGYREQVQVRPGFLNLFALMEGERRALAAADGVVEVRGTDRRLSLKEALALLQAEPADWSPGALLRPLAQDRLLPTAAYVGGPSEIAYHAQIGPAYAELGIPRPMLAPRASLTLLEPSQVRAMQAEGLSLDDLRQDPERVLARWARESNPELEAAFGRAREAVEGELSALEALVAELDPTLRAAAEGARGRALHQVEALRDKATRALKKREHTRAERLRRTRQALFPGGVPQERALGLAGLVGRHGPGVIQEIEAKLDVWARGPQVIRL